jgi:Protein of unknown function (DUF5818)
MLASWLRDLATRVYRSTGGTMQKVNFALVSVLVLTSLCPALPRPGGAGEDKPQVFKGEVMDDMCAKSGSHTEMQKMMKSMGNDAKTCTVECVKLGGKYVLYDAAGKTSYQLDPQDKAKDFAGQKVKVTGTSDGSTIHVKSIEPAS